MANLARVPLLLLLPPLMGLCGGAELFVNANYNKYGTNPYLAPVFNASSPSTPNVPVGGNQEQVNPQPVPSQSIPNVELTDTVNKININENNPSQNEVSSQPEHSVPPKPKPAIPQDAQNPSDQIVPSEANSPKVQPEVLPSSTVAPAVVAQDVQSGSTVLPPLPTVVPENPGSTLLPPVPSVAPEISNNKANVLPQNPSPVNPVPVYQNPSNVPVNNFYPAPPTNVNVQPQKPFGGSQASFPAPNFSNNPYLQGLIPGGSNPNTIQQQGVPQQGVPPQNAVPLPPQNVPQNAVYVPPPQNPQNLVPVPPQNIPVQAPSNPSIPVSPTPGAVYVPPPPQNSQNAVPVPPQNIPVQAPSNPPVPVSPTPGASINPNNPYFQNLNPGASPQNPQAGVANQNPPVQGSNPFFPSVPVSTIPQTPTQSYPTPCTNIPNAIPSSQFPAQGTTYQPQNYYPSTVAAKHLRSRCLKPRGQFPSDKCNYFINCWDNDVREQPCPPGLAFSSKGYCDFEGNVDCNGLPVAAIPVTTKPEGDLQNPQGGLSYASQSPQAPSSQSTVQIVQNPQPTVSVQPIQPSNVPQPTASPSQSPVSQTVPSQSASIPTVPSIQPTVAEGVPPSPQPNSAVTIPAALPDQSNGGNIPVSSSVAPTAAPVPSTTVDPALKAKCLKPRGQFPTEVCNRYINCWDDVVREEECPKGMAFSERGYCDYDFSVNCGNRTYERKSFDATNCPAPHGTFRDKSNCSQYYTCMFGQVVARYGCAAGLSYNDILGVCDYSDKVDCNQAPLVYPPTESHVVMQEIKEGAPNTSKCTPGSIYRLNPQCTSAVLCRYGFTEIVECPPGLAYDTVTDKCLLPHLAKC